MYLAEIGNIMFQYKTGLLPDVFNNNFYEGTRFMIMILGVPVPFMFLSAELIQDFSRFNTKVPCFLIRLV